MANIHIKRGSTSVIITEMQVKTSKRYNFTPARMAINQKIYKQKYWRGYGEKETLLC